MDHVASWRLLFDGRCGHVASCRLLFEFLFAREGSHFPLCGKTQKLRILGVAGMGNRLRRSVATAAEKKQSHPAEGVADSLDEAQGETSPYQKMSWCQKLPKAISG